MPQIVNSQIEGINAQRKANDKDKMRWDPNQFLQSAIQKKQITMGQQKYADQTEALIQAGLVAEGSNNEYGNMHRVYTDWAKPEDIKKVEEMIEKWDAFPLLYLKDVLILLRQFHIVIVYAPVAQGIEHRPPEAGAAVRIRPGVYFFCYF